ncbi:MAG: ROK family protein [Bacteroidota bacterium]
MSNQAGCNVAIDIGGTSIKGAVFSSLDGTSKVSEFRCLTKNNFETDIKNIIESIRESLPNQDVCAVSLSVPGLLSEDRKTLTESRNMTDWKNKPLVESFEKEFPGAKVILENDAKAAALGQAVFSWPGDDFLMVMWGTGLGGSLVRKTKDHKFDLTPLELGHLFLKSKLGKLTLLEDLVGGCLSRKTFWCRAVAAHPCAVA